MAEMQNTLEDIYKSGLRFLASLTPEETYSTIVEEAMKFVDSDFGSVILENNGVLERVYSSNPRLFHLTIRKKGYTYRAVNSDEPVVVFAQQTEKIHSMIKQLGIKRTIYIPLSYEKKPLGVLSLDSKSDKQLTKAEKSTLKLFGSFASLAIKKTQHYYETKQAIELRDYFLSAAAHELRTPLTSISGYTQLLHSKMKQSSGDGIEKKWIDQLYNETNRLTYLINELLEVNRIRSGKADYTWNECHFQQVVMRAIDRLKYHYPTHQIVFESTLQNGSGIIIADIDRLLQVVYNLLENAAEYSDSHSIIKVSLSQTKQSLILKIKDAGKGMPMDEVHQIFHGHFRPKQGEPEKGIGIGLFLVKNILDNHHATMDVKSKINKGTSIIIKLPKYKK